MEDSEDIERSVRSSPESTSLDWSNREQFLQRYESNEISLDTQGSENPMVVKLTKAVQNIQRQIIEVKKEKDDIDNHSWIDIRKTE